MGGPAKKSRSLSGETTRSLDYCRVGMRAACAVLLLSLLIPHARSSPPPSSWDDLASWIIANGGTVATDRIRVRQIRRVLRRPSVGSTGSLCPAPRHVRRHGVVAQEDVAVDTLLLAVPESLIRTPEAVLRDEPWIEILQRRVRRPLSSQDILALFLLKERALGPRAKWYPYIRTLPSMNDVDRPGLAFAVPSSRVMRAVLREGGEERGHGSHLEEEEKTGRTARAISHLCGLGRPSTELSKRTLVAPCGLLEDIREIRADVKHAYHAIRSALESPTPTGGGGGGSSGADTGGEHERNGKDRDTLRNNLAGFSFDAFNWARSMVASRAFTVIDRSFSSSSSSSTEGGRTEGKGTPALVPGADKFNHHAFNFSKTTSFCVPPTAVVEAPGLGSGGDGHAKTGTGHRRSSSSSSSSRSSSSTEEEEDPCMPLHSPYWWNVTSGFFVVHTDRDYRAGDEIRISYGKLSNARLLSNYGFVLTDNPHLDRDMAFTMSEFWTVASEAAATAAAAAGALGTARHRPYFSFEDRGRSFAAEAMDHGDDNDDDVDDHHHHHHDGRRSRKLRTATRMRIVHADVLRQARTMAPNEVQVLFAVALAIEARLRLRSQHHVLPAAPSSLADDIRHINARASGSNTSSTRSGIETGTGTRSASRALDDESSSASSDDDVDLLLATFYAERKRTLHLSLLAAFKRLRLLYGEEESAAGDGGGDSRGGRGKGGGPEWDVHWEEWYQRLACPTEERYEASSSWVPR